MVETPEKLPTCFYCEFENQGFPCRDDKGGLHMDRLAKALLVFFQENDGTPRCEENSWSFDCVDEIVKEAPEAALDFIVFALPMFETDSDIAVLAAGPLENFVQAHGEAMIGAIEREASKNKRFRYLLSGIWGEDHVDPAIWRRIQNAVRKGPWLDDDPRTPQGSENDGSGK